MGNRSRKEQQKSVRRKKKEAIEKKSEGNIKPGNDKRKKGMKNMKQN